MADDSPAPFAHPQLRVLHLRILGRVQSPVFWNSFPGSVLHGAIGFHLKRLSCVISHGRCKECRLHRDCTYGLLYEARPPQDTQRMRKYDRTPSPLRISVFPWQESKLEAGRDLEIHLVLVASAVELVSPLLIAVEESLSEGIGRKILGGQRGRVEVTWIRDGESLAQIPWNDFNPARRLPFMAPAWKDLTYPGSDQVRIQFRTPVRIVARGRICTKPTFRDLMSALMRRISSLAYFAAGVEIEADFKGILERADALNANGEFHRIPVHRYSSRQKSEMALDGMLGFLDLPVQGREFIPWLAVGQRIGVGKNTGMGFGYYTLE